MTDRYQLIAYIATLATLALVFIAALIAADINDALMSKLEVFGLGTITGGLIGVLRIPTANQRAATNVGTADSVNVTPAPEGNQP